MVQTLGVGGLGVLRTEMGVAVKVVTIGFWVQKNTNLTKTNGKRIKT